MWAASIEQLHTEQDPWLPNDYPALHGQTGTMIVVRLGDDVATVRTKIGMGEDDFRNAWRSLNVRVTVD